MRLQILPSKLSPCMLSNNRLLLSGVGNIFHSLPRWEIINGAANCGWHVTGEGKKGRLGFHKFWFMEAFSSSPGSRSRQTLLLRIFGTRVASTDLSSHGRRIIHESTPSTNLLTKLCTLGNPCCAANVLLVSFSFISSARYSIFSFWGFELISVRLLFSNRCCRFEV